MSSSEDEIEAPPERRAPSGRGNKGNRMQRLMADEVEEAVGQQAAERAPPPLLLLRPLRTRSRLVRRRRPRALGGRDAPQ